MMNFKTETGCTEMYPEIHPADCGLPLASYAHRQRHRIRKKIKDMITSL
jgi:hypothetical protein